MTAAAIRSGNQRQKRAAEVGEWHVLDAAGQVLGRVATRAAVLLLGKHRVDWAPHRIAPVFVVVTNTDRVALTGTKEHRKVYRHYTGYPGGVRERDVAEQRRRDSRRLISEAVAGMLPKNSLRDKRLRHLKLYRGSEHPHTAQLSGETGKGASEKQKRKVI